MVLVSFPSRRRVYPGDLEATEGIYWHKSPFQLLELYGATSLIVIRLAFKGAIVAEDYLIELQYFMEKV